MASEQGFGGRGEESWARRQKSALLHVCQQRRCPLPNQTVASSGNHQHLEEPIRVLSFALGQFDYPRSSLVSDRPGRFFLCSPSAYASGPLLSWNATQALGSFLGGARAIVHCLTPRQSRTPYGASLEAGPLKIERELGSGPRAVWRTPSRSRGTTTTSFVPRDSHVFQIRPKYPRATAFPST